MRRMRGLICVAVFAVLAFGSAPAVAQTSNNTVDGLRVTRAEGTLAVINWQRLPGADSYNVYLNDDPALTDTDGWITITGLDFVTSYSVTIAAVVDGVEGPRSSPVTFETTDIRLGDPRLLLDTGLFKLSSTRVPLAWNDQGPQANIELFRDGVQLDPGSILEPFFFGRLFDTDVVPGETYVYKARFNSNLTGAKGPFGPDVTVTIPLGASGPPTLVSTYADTSVTVLRLENLEPARSNQFEVERNGESIGVFARRLGGETEWFADARNLPRGVSTYRVRVISAGGDVGPWSAPTETAPLTAPPLVGT